MKKKSIKKIISLIVISVMLMSILLPMTAFADQNIQSAKSGFVYADGTKLMLDGHPFYFAGANSYDLFTYGDGSSTQTKEDIETKYMYKDKIDTIMSQMAQDGVTVLRTWGFSNESWHGFELSKGVYNEAEFMLFDYIMDSARRNGIKVIITLENYWEAYGGIDRKLQWEGLSGGNHTSRAQFFSNKNCREHYKAYAEHFINRINHYTGIAYKDDPTIFAWDLMNEPRYQDAAVNENTTGLTLRAWVDEMGAYIKSLDSNHMVFVGIEGHQTKYGFGGDEGNPFVYIQQSPYIDFCSAHPYPDEYWANLTPEKQAALTKAWINDAHNIVGKPFVATEFNTHNNKDLYWPSVFGVIEQEGAAGGLFWEYNSRKLSDFTIVHGDSILTYFKAHSGRMAAKNTPENSVSPANAVFDRKSDKQADITLTMNMLSGNTLTAIKNGSAVLVKGTDYTISGNTVVIKKSYLGTLPFDSTTLTFDVSSGFDPSVTITVVDSGILNSALNPAQASFDLNVAKQADLTVTLIKNGNTFVGIKNGTSQLVNGTDYTVSEDTVVIKKSYLAGQAAGTLNLSFDFNQGTDPVLKVTIVNTTGVDIIDNFEGYSNSASNLKSAYSRNENGNTVTVDLDTSNKSEGSYGMSYAYTVGSPNYAGVTRSLNGKNCSGYTGISFWLKPDGSNRDLTVQIRETNGDYWETNYTLSGKTATTVTIPFSSFAHPSWTSGTHSVPDLSSIAEYSLYVGQGSGTAGSGTLYFDNVRLVDVSIPKDTQAPTAPTNLASPSQTSTSVNLTWTASTDNIGVTGYDIYRGTTLVGSTASTSYTVAGLAANTTYSFTVRAKDAAGNVSAESSALSATTSKDSDTQAPTAPANLASPSQTSTAVNLTWTASTDNIGVTGYDIYRGTTLVGSTTSTSYTVTGLSAATGYSFTVIAKDAAGNISSVSNTLYVTTSSLNSQYPEWNVNAQYVGGDIVTHNGKLWKAEWWTNHEEPGTTGVWGVWREYTK
jgi:mannan endo-1,4-beta-mannosidase